MMTSVSVLGVGKVGTHLIKNFINHREIKLVQIYSRSKTSLKLFKDTVATTTNILELKTADIYIIALPDDVIKTIDLSHLKGLVVHTSGTVSYQNLNAKKRGVFYPLQSFSKEKEINFKKVPFCLETEYDEDYDSLEKLTQLLSSNYQKINHHKRQKLHLAAIFANNFSNRMIGIAYDLCKQEHITFNLLQPLIEETFLKIKSLPPSVAQTGPAIREDKETIQKHLNQLKGLNKDIYKAITQSIQEQKHAEL